MSSLSIAQTLDLFFIVVQNSAIICLNDLSSIFVIAITSLSKPAHFYSKYPRCTRHFFFVSDSDPGRDWIASLAASSRTHPSCRQADRRRFAGGGAAHPPATLVHKAGQDSIGVFAFAAFVQLSHVQINLFLQHKFQHYLFHSYFLI